MERVVCWAVCAGVAGAQGSSKLEGVQVGDIDHECMPRGLGLPDRDYYLRDEARFRGVREKYVVHAAAMEHA